MVIAISLLVISTTIAFAYSSGIWTGTVNGKPVAAEEGINIGIPAWTGYIWSYSNSSPRQPIGTLGWDWWTNREICSGTIVSQTQMGGFAVYGDTMIERAQYNAWYSGSCGSPHQIVVLGQHDFMDGTASWFPQESYPYTLN